MCRSDESCAITIEEDWSEQYGKSYLLGQCSYN